MGGECELRHAGGLEDDVEVAEVLGEGVRGMAIGGYVGGAE